ncbi:hypothetical protein BH11PLA1_BH11PLA1_20480 [soil metagenome]
MTTAPLPARQTLVPQASRAGSASPAHAPGNSHAGTVDPVRIIKRYKWLLAGAAMLGLVLGFIANEVLKRVYPVWRSTMVYQVLRPIGKVADPDSGTIDRDEFERFAATQARVIASDRVIRDAVEKNNALREQTEWIKSFRQVDPATGLDSIATADAAQDLKDRVTARVVAGTSLIEVSVATRNREDAPLLAAAVHQSYFEDLKAVTRATTLDKRTPIEVERARLITQLEGYIKTEQEIIERFGITSITEQGMGLQNKEMQLNQEINDAQKMTVFATETLKKLNEQLKQEGGVIYNDEQREAAERDNLVMQLKGRLADLRSEDDSLAQRGYGENHKDRVAVRTRVDSVQTQLDAEREKTLEKIFYSDKDRAEKQVKGSEAQLNQLTTQREDTRLDLRKVTQARARIADTTANKDALRIQLAGVENALRELQLADELVRGERIDRIRRVEIPRTPDILSFPRLIFMLPLGLILTVGLVGGSVVLREVLDQRVRGPADISLIPRVRLLGIVPLASEDPTRPVQVETAFRDSPTGAVSEGFRHIRSAVARRLHHGGHRSLVIMSGAPGSGATTTACNLAMGFAASDLRVLLIDANFRKPALHRVLKLAEGPGLADILARKTELKSALQQTSTPNLSLLSAGTAVHRAIPERLATDTMRQIIKDAGESFDLVIVDTAPGMVASDGNALANRCDASMLVLHAMREKRGFVARLRDQLSDAHGEFLGVVVNGVRGSSGGYLRQNIKASYEYQALPSA